MTETIRFFDGGVMKPVATRRALIIDDEAEIRRNLTFGLTQHGFACTSCPDGISAIHELNRGRQHGVGYDYLITDIFMPDIDGLKILKVIKKMHPDLPVLVITGFGDDDLKKVALAEKNTGYLDKPFEIKDLVAALNNLTPGSTTLDRVEGGARTQSSESITSYITVRVPKIDQLKSVCDQLSFVDGIISCEAVKGPIDVVLIARSDSTQAMDKVYDRVKAVSGIEIVSQSPVERPKLDREVEDFITEYENVVKGGSRKPAGRDTSLMTSYLLVDIDPAQIQQIYTTTFFIDEVLFCDVIDGGSKLIGMVIGPSRQSATNAIEKLQQVNGVQRVREAKVIKMT